MILKCNCKHGWQDQRYGRGNRVHNQCKDRSKASCTVCGDTKSSGISPVIKKGK